MKKNLKKVLGMTLVLTSIATSAFAANHISSYVKRETSGGQYRANGWVSIQNDSGRGVYHYTTARLESLFGGTVYTTSGRKYGTGTVHARTPYNGNKGHARIYYGY